MLKIAGDVATILGLGVVLVNRMMLSINDVIQELVKRIKAHLIQEGSMTDGHSFTIPWKDLIYMAAHSTIYCWINCFGSLSGTLMLQLHPSPHFRIVIPIEDSEKL